MRAVATLALVAGMSVATDAAAQKRNNRWGAQHDGVEWSTSVPRSGRSQIWFGFALTPDCQTLRGWNVRIEQLPRNGMASLQRSQARVSPGWLQRPHMNPRQIDVARHCLGRDTLVITLHYRPRAGFTGMDELAFVVTSGDSQRSRRHQVTVDVQ